MKRLEDTMNIRSGIKVAVAAFVAFAIIGSMAFWSGSVIAQNVACYRQQGGSGVVMGSGCTITFASGSTWKIGSTTVSATGAELNTTAGVTAGTVTTGKALVVDSNKALDTLTLAAIKLGAGAGTSMTSTAAELNVNAGVTPGTIAASKTLVVDSNKKLDGADMNKVVTTTANSKRVAFGQLSNASASDTVVTGLTTVASCIAVLDDEVSTDPENATCSIGDQAGAPAAGSVLIKTWKTLGGTPAAATTFTKKVNWFASGT